MRRQVPLLGIVLGLAAIAHLVILSDLPIAWRSVAALVLTGALPGVLLVEWLVGRSDAPLETGERALYSVAAGYAVMVLVMLGVTYLPGGVARWQTLAAFDLVLLALGLLLVRQPSRPEVVDPAWPPLARCCDRRWLVAGLLSIFLVGGFLRITDLGYSEFQGDEARAVLRAAGAIQGYEDVLLIHKKGPTEILLPTVLYSLTGRLTENLARFPFAIANLAGLFAVFLLGWRLFHPIAGWTAAMFLALDGYFIGFSRIVQYQSVVFLTTVLAVLIFYRLYRLPRALPNYLTLAALLVATGLLSHYEAALAAVPGAFLLWALWRRGVSLLCLARALAAPVVVGGAALAVFYVPFVLHPNFRATFIYLTDRRIGGSFPYNNLADFFLRTTLYSTTYQILLLIGLALVGLIVAYRRGFGPRWGWLLAGLVLAGLAVAVWQPGWLRIGGTDYTVVVFVLAFLAVWLAPRQPVEERVLWLWLGLPLIVAIFLTLKPRTHVYIFFAPWALLAGWTIARAWQWFHDRQGRRAAIAVGTPVALASIAVFGLYGYWYFVYNEVEVLRTWAENRPPGYWTVYETPDDKALFGFPLQMGWKVVGELYRTGELTGPYDSNEQEAWVPDWYTRTQRRCLTTASYYFLVNNLEPEGVVERQLLESWLANEWHLYGTVTVGGDPRMRIYERNGVGQPASEPRTFDALVFEQSFDIHNSDWDFPLKDPVIEPSIPNPVSYMLGDGIQLVGYALSDTTVHPGESLELTLFWRTAHEQVESYTVFAQIINPNVAIYGQQDSPPVCGSRPTYRWEPGALVADQRTIPVRPDADTGTFPLIVGMYQAERGVRLDVFDENGAPIGNQIELTQITIEPIP